MTQTTITTPATTTRQQASGATAIASSGLGGRTGSLTDRPVVSLQQYDATRNAYGPALSADFAGLIEADFETSDPLVVGKGHLWSVTLPVAEVVGLLRCLDELAAVYADTAIAAPVRREAGRLRRRAHESRTGS